MSKQPVGQQAAAKKAPQAVRPSRPMVASFQARPMLKQPVKDQYTPPLKPNVASYRAQPMSRPPVKAQPVGRPVAAAQAHPHAKTSTPAQTGKNR